MTTIENDFGFALDEPTERPSRAAKLFGRIIEGLRRYAAAREQMRLLRQLPDSTLIDIGIDPRSVRDGYPTIPTHGRTDIIYPPR